jgi:hypothetical protein
MFSNHMLVEMKFREKHCFGTNLTKISAIFPRPNVFSNDVDSKSVFYNAGKLLCYEIGMMFQQCFIGKIFSTGFAEMSFFIFVNAFFM